MSIKIDRHAVYEKTQGHCAYCGKTISFKEMQVDHIKPKRRGCKGGGDDSIDNLLPSCIRCNRSKTVYSIEQFRAKLKHDVDRLYKNAQFNNALRFGLVKVIDKNVVFWFEQILKEYRNG